MVHLMVLTLHGYTRDFIFQDTCSDFMHFVQKGELFVHTALPTQSHITHVARSRLKEKVIQN